MDSIPLSKEAAIIIAGMAGVTTAVVGLLVAFNAPINEDQRNAIVATAIACGIFTFGVGPVIRQFVWSKNSVEKVVTEAYEATPGVDPKPKV